LKVAALVDPTVAIVVQPVAGLGRPVVFSVDEAVAVVVDAVTAHLGTGALAAELPPVGLAHTDEAVTSTVPVGSTAVVELIGERDRAGHSGQDDPPQG